MPSPQESTRPVSRTEMLPSKPLISFLRISLISDGLISAMMSFVSRLAGKPALCLREASCKAAVVDFCAQFRGQPAEQRGVDGHSWDDFFGGDRLEATHYARNFGVRRLNRKGERRALTAHRLIEQVAIRLGDRTELANAAVARDHERKRAQGEAEIEAFGNFRHRLLPRLLGQLGRRETLEQLGRIDHRRQPLELDAPLFLVALVCQIEQGARVTPGDSRTFHCRSPGASLSMKPSMSRPWSAG